MKRHFLMNTIDQTHKRAVEEGLGVSKNFIRQSVINGSLPCVRAGNRYLINWTNFLQFLETPQLIQQSESQAKVGGIRPVPENVRR